MRVSFFPLAVVLVLPALPVRASDYKELVSLAQEWRHFAEPAIDRCVPNYKADAMLAKKKGLAAFQARVKKLQPEGWTASQRVDLQLVAAEMNGLDFDLRVRKPWARDPSFYATVFGERSDVPQHEGVTASPVIDLFLYDYPLSSQAQLELTCTVGAIPALLEQAKQNLNGSNAHDLWAYSTRTLHEQSQVLDQLQQGTLEMRTLEGKTHGDLVGASDELKKAAQAAKAATDGFISWIDARAKSKTGPSGVGKESYNWYAKNVHLSPYDWDQQVTLLRRELERARASLQLEEFRNRSLPQLEPKNTPESFRALGEMQMKKLTDFLIASGIVPEKPYYRDAMARQVAGWVPPEKRNFFYQGIAREPLGLFSHSYHWTELARVKNEPNASEIRRMPALFDMYDARSEGLATAMEETLMQAGLYDDEPRGREIVWIMLANRAARGLASLYVQANLMNLQQGGAFHARWTPRGWSDPKSDLVGFEQLLYLRQPGYGSSYITGKMEFERLISDYAMQQEQAGKPFNLGEFFAQMNQSGTIPFSLVEQEMVASPLRLPK